MNSLTPALIGVGQLFFIIAAGGLLYLKNPRPAFREGFSRWIKRFFPKERSGEYACSLRRLLPLSFLCLATLAIFSGFLYAPNNFDALSYRIPRVLHWLQDEAWLWIQTTNSRMNNRATGFEWMSVPHFALFNSDRALFLINIIPFLLLPGALFGFLREFGASRRVAWLWMWTFPLAYGYLLQSASTANDAAATLYSITAVFAAQRFSRLGNSSDLWFCLAASSLLTGIKASNLPLLLPVALLIMPAWRRLLGHWRLLFFSFPLFLAGSFGVNAALNQIYCGDWTGASLEAFHPVRDAWAGILGNLLQLLAQSFNPPFFPGARQWDERLCSLLPPPLLDALNQNFMYGFKLGFAELPTEGAGLSWSLIMVLLLAFLLSPKPSLKTGSSNLCQAWGLRLLLAGAAGACLFLTSKSSIFGASRIFLPYYPLLLAGVMVRPKWPALAHSRLFRLAVFLNILFAGVALIFEPSRPLWPAHRALQSFSFKPGTFLDQVQKRALAVYSNYGQRAEVFSPLRNLLPEDEVSVGFFNGGDDPMASLWKPYGSVRITELTPKDNSNSIRQKGVRYVMIGERGAADLMSTSVQDWAKSIQGDIVADVTLFPAVSRGPEQWALIFLGAKKESGAGP